MNGTFQYDVSLSHSAKDKAVVRLLAERLRQDGLKVWPGPPKRLRAGGFDEWELRSPAGAGLEPLGKRRKVLAEGKGPARAEGAGATESLRYA